MSAMASRRPRPATIVSLALFAALMLATAGQSHAVECTASGEAGNPANDGDNSANTACGSSADATGEGARNTAYGLATKAFGSDGRNIAIGSIAQAPQAAGAWGAGCGRQCGRRRYENDFGLCWRFKGLFSAPLGHSLCVFDRAATFKHRTQPYEYSTISG